MDELRIINATKLREMAKSYKNGYGYMDSNSIGFMLEQILSESTIVEDAPPPPTEEEIRKVAIGTRFIDLEIERVAFIKGYKAALNKTK